MFSFNFVDNDAKDASAFAPSPRALAVAAAGAVYDAPAAEELVNEEGEDTLNGEQLVTVSQRVTLIKGTVSTAKAAQLLEHADVVTSDLIPGRYEGGFKLWEGGVDLASFLASDASFDSPRAMLGLRVLELGCGHGLPGLVALLAGASVHFQDYNKEVIRGVTMPNTAANWRAHCCRLDSAQVASPPVRFFSGEWESLARLLQHHGLQGTYDMVLSAETIYNMAAMSNLYNCIKQCLKRPAGVAYIASKSYYFGVGLFGSAGDGGGGVASFIQMVHQDGAMQGRVVKTLNDRKSNTRAIIKLCWVEEQ